MVPPGAGNRASVRSPPKPLGYNGIEKSGHPSSRYRSFSPLYHSRTDRFLPNCSSPCALAVAPDHVLDASLTRRSCNSTIVIYLFDRPLKRNDEAECTVESCPHLYPPHPPKLRRSLLEPPFKGPIEGPGASLKQAVTQGTRHHNDDIRECAVPGS